MYLFVELLKSRMRDFLGNEKKFPTPLEIREIANQ